jgi:hypothetical protein
LPTPQVPPVNFTGCQMICKHCRNKPVTIDRLILAGARTPKRAARWACARCPFLCRLQLCPPLLPRLPFRPVQTARTHGARRRVVRGMTHGALWHTLAVFTPLLVLMGGMLLVMTSLLMLPCFNLRGSTLQLGLPSIASFGLAPLRLLPCLAVTPSLPLVAMTLQCTHRLQAV